MTSYIFFFFEIISWTYVEPSRACEKLKHYVIFLKFFLTDTYENEEESVNIVDDIVVNVFVNVGIVSVICVDVFE